MTRKDLRRRDRNKQVVAAKRDRAERRAGDVAPPGRAQDLRLCGYLGQGFCPASVDGYCVGGTTTGRCHG